MAALRWPSSTAPGRWSDEQILEEHWFAEQLPQRKFRSPRPGNSGIRRCATSAASASPSRRARAARGPELEDPEVLTWIGRLLGRLHTVGRQQPFEHRVRWASARPGIDARDWLLASDSVPLEIQPAWHAVVTQCLTAIQQAFDAIPDLQTLRLHGDCHPGNILWTPDKGPHFVDLDDAVTGPAIQDLWMLLSGDALSIRQQLACVLEGYDTVAGFDRRELALIEPLRTLRMIHHSAWLARRWTDPAFPAGLPLVRHAELLERPGGQARRATGGNADTAAGAPARRWTRTTSSGTLDVS